MPALSIRSERELGQVVLEGTAANIDGDQDQVFTFPNGFGDCYLIRAAVIVSSVLTMVANPELLGPVFLLQDPAVVTQDIVGHARWTQYINGRVVAQLAPLIAPLVRESETFTVQFEEVDTNAVPTADLTVQLLVQRRRNIGAVEPATAEPQLRFTS